MTAFSKATRLAIIGRDNGMCAGCGRTVADPETGRPVAQFSIQHRRARGMGGSSDVVTGSAVNGLLLCGTGTTGCHGHTESHPDWARERGYRVDSWDSPETVPVTIRVAPGIDQVFGLDGDTRYPVHPRSL